MFDSLKVGESGIRIDAATICFVLGWLPLVVLWGERNTAFTEWLVQTYFLTVFIFVVYPRKYERKNLKRIWFWRAMLTMALVVHPVILAAMWFVDVWEKTKWHEATTMLTIVLVASIIEAPLLYKIVDFFRPPDEGGGAPN